MENTSGKGKDALVPKEIRGWNWGAFLWNWVWALGNKTYIGLAAFLPFVGIVVPFILGAKGNEWAWRNKEWKSVEHFKKTQRLWTLSGVAVLLLCLAGIGALFASGAFDEAMDDADESANTLPVRTPAPAPSMPAPAAPTAPSASGDTPPATPAAPSAPVAPAAPTPPVAPAAPVPPSGPQASGTTAPPPPAAPNRSETLTASGAKSDGTTASPPPVTEPANRRSYQGARDLRDCLRLESNAAIARCAEIQEFKR